jgi:hypothetical protein
LPRAESLPSLMDHFLPVLRRMGFLRERQRLRRSQRAREAHLGQPYSVQCRAA